MRKKIRKIFGTILSIVTLGFISVGLASCGADENEIIAVTTGSPSPYVIVNEDGSITGYDVEVLRAAVARLDGYTLKVEKYERASCFTGVQSGQFDLTVNNWGYNTSRAETYYYSYPYLQVKYGIIQSKNDTPISTLAEVAAGGYSVITNSGSAVGNAIETWNSKNPSKQIKLSYSSEDTSFQLQKIADGNGSIRIDDLPVYAAWAKAYPEVCANLQITEVSTEEALENIASSMTSHLLFGKSERGDKLRKLISEQIYELKKDGTLSKLSKEFFGVDLAPEDSQFTYLN